VKEERKACGSQVEARRGERGLCQGHIVGRYVIHFVVDNQGVVVVVVVLCCKVYEYFDDIENRIRTRGGPIYTSFAVETQTTAR